MGFIKFGQANHIIDSFEKEYLYFSPLREFRAPKKDHFGMYDAREANLKIIQGNRLTVKIGEKEIALHEMSDEFSCQYQEHPKVIPGNICSLYTLEMDGDETIFKFDDRLFKENGSALVIYNANKFVTALDNSLASLAIGQIRKRVTYYDPKATSGELSFFHKDSYFSFQNEYRIFLKTTGDEALKIAIPGLKEFSKIVEYSKLINLRASYIPSSEG